MKNLKNILIYGAIILLCIAAFTGYMLKSRSEKASTPVADTTVSESVSTTAKQTVSSQQSESSVIQEKVLPKHVEEVMAKSTVVPDANPLIGIGRGEDYEKVTVEAIENAGGLKDIIKKGQTVLIKPNICTYAEAGSPQITDYRVVREIASMVTQLGASKVIIAEGTIVGNAFADSFLAINKYDTIEGVELVNLNAFDKEDCYELKPQRSMTGKALFIPKIYMDVDVVISVAKLKTHFQPDAVVSLVLKNAIGVPPGNIYGLGSKDGLHNLGLKESIVDINKIRKPDFCVIEGIVGGEGNGPLSNTPVKSDIIFAGRDPVAIDTVALNFMGFSVDMIPHVGMAGRQNLGISDIDKIKIAGADLNSIKMSFAKAVSP
jgi:uncharacterized protein (DUF362 family)